MTIPVWCRSIRCRAFTQAARSAPWLEIGALTLVVALTLVLRKPGESVASSVFKALSAIENLGDIE